MKHQNTTAYVYGHAPKKRIKGKKKRQREFILDKIFIKIFGERFKKWME